MNEMIAERYLTASELGHGGMADVYLAMDTVLNREVAIKILRGELCADPVALLRFQREANAASGLNHPNIVEIYDVGEWEGRQYIVMEYVRGKTLKQLIASRGAIDAKEAGTIMKQLIEATAEAHRHGIIHRDIKPQNVLVKDDGTVKITDFGIALAQDAIQLTQTDAVMGSVHYLAPEVARGETASVQSDIYSLGIVFYELLTGDVPYHGESPVQVAMMHMQEELPSVRAFDSSIPQSIENLIIKATAKNKVYRYNSADDMLTDLDSAFDEKRINEAKLILGQEENGETILMPKVGATVKPPQKEKNFLATGLGISLMILAAVAMIVIILLNPFGNASKQVKLSNLAGMTLDEAQTELTRLGLSMGKTTYQVTDDIEKGIVINSSPSMDNMVEKGSTVNVTVSDGTYFVIENYAGKTEAEVRALLSGKRITIRTEKAYDETVKAGTIIRQELLEEGDKCDPNRQYEIKLIISSYLEFTMPANLVGMNVFEAKNLLESKGAMVLLHPLSTDGLSEEQLAAITRNTVISYTPDNGVYVQYEDNSITLYYY